MTAAFSRARARGAAAERRSSQSVCEQGKKLADVARAREAVSGRRGARLADLYRDAVTRGAKPGFVGQVVTDIDRNRAPQRRRPKQSAHDGALPGDAAWDDFDAVRAFELPDRGARIERSRPRAAGRAPGREGPHPDDGERRPAPCLQSRRSAARPRAPQLAHAGAARRPIARLLRGPSLRIQTARDTGSPAGRRVSPGRSAAAR